MSGLGTAARATGRAKVGRGVPWDWQTRGGSVATALVPDDSAADDIEVASFCEAIWTRLLGAMSLSVGDADLAQDLTQETLVRVVERWSRIREMANAEGYVFQMGFNLGRSWWRRRAAEGRANSRAGSKPGVLDQDSSQRIAVRAAIRQLAPRQREAVVYRFYLGFGVEETAFAMRCRPGTVKALTSQAIDGLRAAGLRVDDE